MTNTDANRMTAYELKDELGRLCLPSSSRDPNRKLAWLNSICILFLLIGIFGARPAGVHVQAVPPVEEIAPVALAVPPPPQTVTPTQTQPQNEPQPSETLAAVVVVPNAPSINFSVPTIGNLVAPSALAQAPPLNPMQPFEPVAQFARISNTGASGSRPQPPYPQIAADAGEQGTVTLQIRADANGRVASVEIKNSSGFPVLDRATEDFIKRHWILPAGASTNQLFETSIIYKLQG